MNDKLIIALRTTIMGMGIVILALYILSIILDFMKYLFHPDKKETKSISKQPEHIQELETKSEKDKTHENMEDEQIVAVISAALSAYLERPVNQIKICTIRKIHKQTPIWGMASRLKNKL